MTDTDGPDVYEVAVLAGGPLRAVDAAVTVLLETGRLRAQRSGELTVVEPTSGHPVEQAVLDAVAGASLPMIGAVRHLAVRDARLGAVRDGLRSRALLRKPFLGSGRPSAPTRAGRDALTAARGGPSRDPVSAGTSGWWVALDGPGAMPDEDLRAAAFTSFDERARRRGRAGDSGWYAGAFFLPADGSDNGHRGGHGGGDSCGGSSSSCSSSSSSCGGGGGCGGGT